MRQRFQRHPTRTVALALIASISGLFWQYPLLAQQGSAASSGRLTGTVGVFGEAYTASGISNRRDATSGMVFGRAASNGRDLRYGFQFMLASEQAGSRQAMNRVSVNLGYRFVGLTIGDLSPVLSEFSVNGATIRGGAAEITFGPYMASFMHGRVRRSVNPTGSSVFGRRTFSEWLTAARIGAGKSSGTHIHLVGVVARDDAASLADSLGTSPAENVSITPDAGLRLFGDRLHLRATYTLSAFSANTEGVETDGVSTMLGFFTPRVGSRIDYAADISAHLNLQTFRARASYE
ncbi:MAG: hypothetical protein R3178_02245, partial [Rhodothermales bacterium]|nr:hypothetical protein [Rhodothermales bacterium]